MKCKLPKHTLSNVNRICEGFMGWLKKSIHGLTKTRISYELIWLKIKITRQISKEAPYTRFQKIVWIVSLIREKRIYNPYVSELDFIMNQYDRESEFV